jgi:hypothetical protein
MPYDLNFSIKPLCQRRSNALETSTNPLEAEDRLNLDLHVLDNWTKQWLVDFNPQKTEYMVISFRQNITPINLKFNSVEAVPTYLHPLNNTHPITHMHTLVMAKYKLHIFYLNYFLACNIKSRRSAGVSSGPLLFLLFINDIGDDIQSLVSPHYVCNGYVFLDAQAGCQE